MALSPKEKHWQPVFEDFQGYGVSQRQYCIAKDIKPRQYAENSIGVNSKEETASETVDPS
jgi:hypothetical protein